MNEHMRKIEDSMLEAGEYEPATYEEAMARFDRVAEMLGQGTVQDLIVFAGSGFMTSITTLCGALAEVCSGNADAVREVLRIAASTQYGEGFQSETQRALDRSAEMAAELCVGLIGLEVETRRSVLDRSSAELLAGVEDFLACAEYEGGDDAKA